MNCENLNLVHMENSSLQRVIHLTSLQDRGISVETGHEVFCPGRVWFIPSTMEGKQSNRHHLVSL